MEGKVFLLAGSAPVFWVFKGEVYFFSSEDDIYNLFEYPPYGNYIQKVFQNSAVERQNFECLHARWQTSHMTIGSPRNVPGEVQFSNKYNSYRFVQNSAKPAEKWLYLGSKKYLLADATFDDSACYKMRTTANGPWGYQSGPLLQTQQQLDQKLTVPNNNIRCSIW